MSLLAAGPFSNIDMAGLVAFIVAVAGAAVIVIGAVLGWQEYMLTKQIRASLYQAAASAAGATPPKGSSTGGIAGSAETQAAVLSSSADVVTALAELAKNMTGLSKAIQAFLIASILFFIAASTATIDAAVT